MLLALRKYRERGPETPWCSNRWRIGTPRTRLRAADILRAKCRGMHEARDARCHATTIEGIAGRPACRGMLIANVAREWLSSARVACSSPPTTSRRQHGLGKQCRRRRIVLNKGRCASMSCSRQSLGSSAQGRSSGPIPN